MSLQPRVLATGLGFPEGPVHLGKGEVAFVEMERAQITRFDGRSTTLFAKTGGGPNGATLAADGSIWVANNGGLSLGSRGYWFSPEFADGRIQRVRLDGSCVDLPNLPGEPAHRPNDLCFGPDGMLYITDPRNWEDLGNLQPGRIWRLDPATGGADLLAEVPLFCNGIAFGPDDRLYVAQTMAMKILAFDWSPTGLSDPVEHAVLPRGFPDGFCFSAGGDCYVCGATADVIQIFDSAGTLKDTIDLPEHTDPLNCCLGDGFLYVTCAGPGQLLAFELGVDALPLFPFRR